MVVRAGSVMSGLLVVLFPVFFAFFFSAVFVVQVAASRAGNSSKSGAGKGILIEDGSANGTGGNADGSAGGEMLFLGSAGGERKGKDGYGESGKESVHVFLEKMDVRTSRTEPAVISLWHPYTGQRGNCHSGKAMGWRGVML